ncbi:glucose 1-dehydrogenase [Brevibacillus borstelensis]|uniref:Gluconate dehydrogenase n=1 Tax=Brevibacillus borstelensis AK1 TaxID=1300222 RepID=M8E415_9BACL|nr:glucose 1-dehydrogenase [Brevibacillus borstelensis]EMT54026.1 gluconate dehydrogenase [Brevibacillus borstelensis AK1]KKX53866.1 2-deoxy-D-gluconate 3-dehydrogenase [Brevibacillus borstelensis cifa_chp40]MCC0563721.1 glucose 1-dehydrogenase [Brevibacillus borstelensis]MCM3559275.1 glucose 1-dehydrogenase [Brevibacillus borstelensis]MCM3589288.1 glucose 1-dehydrogenase [Brevibacillus borstelensis]
MNRFDVTGKTAVVTGAGRGIGKALALGLAEAGAKVACVARTETDIREVVREIQQMGGTAFAIQADLTEDAAPEKVAASVMEKWGRWDILINNAGMNIRKQALDVSTEDWDKVVDLNLKSTFRMCQAAGRIMCEQRYGRIVNIASVAGLVALRTGVAYGASKSGVIHMTRVLALEWSKYGVNINAIAPWYFRTPLTEKLLDDPAFLQEVLSRTPSGRIGNAEDLVGPAIFLASDAAAYISGQTIAVDGGMSVYGF